MTKFDPNAFMSAVQNGMASYAGDAPAVLMEVERNGLSVELAQGTLSLDDSTLATNEAKYEIGSQTKMMTATVVLQMASEGFFSLDDKLCDVMDVTPLAGIANLEEVTLRQLVTHSSGIPDYSNDFNEPGAPSVYAPLLQDPPQPVGVWDAIQFLIDQNAPAEFAPGTSTDYSNTGFVLLQLAIESVSGNALAEEFQTRIFDPVGMRDSSLPGYGRPDGIINSYLQAGDQQIDVTHLPLDNTGDGGAVSTTADMIKFMKALVLDQTLVPADQMGGLEQFFAAVGFDDGEMVGHNGRVAGTQSMTLVHLESGLIFTAVETMAQPEMHVQDLLVNTMIAVSSSASWEHFDAGKGDLEFKMSAAELNVQPVEDAKGALQTLLEANGVSLTLDTAIGDLDTDRMVFEDGSALLVADSGGSRLSIRAQAKDALNADNQLIGQDGNDRLIGGQGDDKILGGAGNDKLIGRSGHDLIVGGEGNDRLVGNRGKDTLDGGQGDDRLLGSKGADVLDGGVGNDELRGHRGADSLNGGGGDDVLSGGRGNDLLIGGSGQDVLMGGQGADTFLFAEGAGHDVIVGFDQGQDKIDLSALELEFNDLTITEFGDGAVQKITYAEASILVCDTDQSLTIDDFVF